MKRKIGLLLLMVILNGCCCIQPYPRLYILADQDLKKKDMVTHEEGELLLKDEGIEG